MLLLTGMTVELARGVKPATVPTVEPGTVIVVVSVGAYTVVVNTEVRFKDGG
jgi:ribosomal protein L2